MFTLANHRIRAPRMRLYLAQLAVCFVVFVGASRARAELQIYCTPNPNFEITCSIIGGLDNEELGLESNQGMLTCTNCVNMKPSKCEVLKQDLIASFKSIIEKAQRHELTIISLRDNIIEKQLIQDYYGTFVQCEPFQGNTITYEQYLYYENFNYSELEGWQAQFIQGPSFGDFPNGVFDPTAAASICQTFSACVNSSYWLAQDIIARLQILKDDLTRIGQNLVQDFTRSATLGISVIEENMTCAPCVLGADPTIGGGGVEGGISSVVEKYLEMIVVLLEEIRNETLDINKTLLEIKDKVHVYGLQIIDQLGYMTNFVHRLDDYVFADFTNAVNVVSSNIVLIANSMNQDRFLQKSYSNAVYNVDREGQTVINEERLKSVFELDNNRDSALPFNIDKYFEIDNWFARTELLLLNIAGLTSTSNATEVTDQEMEEFDEQFKDLDANAQSVTNDVYSVRNKIEQVKEKYMEFLDSLNPLSSTIQPNYQIEFLPRVSFNENDLVAAIDPIILDLEYGDVAKVSDIVELSRVFFNLIWMLTSLLFELSFFIFICKLVLGIVSWCMMYMRDFFR